MRFIAALACIEESVLCYGKADNICTYLVGLLEDGCDVSDGEDEVGLHRHSYSVSNQSPEGQHRRRMPAAHLSSSQAPVPTSQNIPIPGRAQDLTQKKNEATAPREWNLQTT